MKLLFFDDFKLGVLNGDQVVDVSDAVKDIPRVGPQDVINGVITGWATYKGKLEAAAKAGGGAWRPDLGAVRPPGWAPVSASLLRSRAGVAQLVEHELPKLGVAGSSPVARSS